MKALTLKKGGKAGSTAGGRRTIGAIGHWPVCAIIVISLISVVVVVV